MSLFVIGDGLAPARRVLRKLGEAGARRSLVVDFGGVSSGLISPDEAATFLAESRTWVDLGDIRNPARVLEYDLDERGLGALAATMRAWASALQRPLLSGDETLLQRFCRSVFHSPKEPGVPEGGRWLSLLDLRASLSNEEIARWAWPKGEDVGATRRARRRVLAVLDDALSFAHVGALATGRSPLRPVDLQDVDVAWLELPAPHLEPIEWKLIAAVILARLPSFQGAGAPRSSLNGERLCVLFFPPAQILQALATQPAVLAASGIIVLQRHPSGAPPELLTRLAETGQDFSVEFLPPEAAKASSAWARVLGKKLPGEADTSRALAYRVGAGGSKAQPPEILDGSQTDEAPAALYELRRQDARGRIRLGVGHAALSVSTSGLSNRTDDPFLRLCRIPTLRIAWSTLRIADAAAAGIDGVTARGFGSRLEAELAQLALSLAEGSYQPLPVKWTTVPKRSGGQRNIGLTALRDRVVQRAFLSIAEPYFEPHFSDHSFGFRPHRGAHHAVSALLAAWSRGQTSVARLDVESCFDTLPHELILSRFAERVPSARMLAVLARWLRVGTGHVAVTGGPGIGVVQGYVLAPFLSNIVLSELDEALEDAGLDFARYADDLALFSGSEEEARQSVNVVKEVLRTRLRMRLNERKTRIGKMSEGVDYLGFLVGGPGTLAIAEQRFRETKEELRHAVFPADPSDPARTDRWLRRLQLQLAGFGNYYCRLGLTKALYRQFGEFTEVLAELRRGLAPSIRDLPAWDALPGPRSFRERFGVFQDFGGGTPVRPGLESHPYAALEAGEASQWVMAMVVETVTPTTVGEVASAPPASGQEDWIGLEMSGRTAILFEEKVALRPDAEGVALVRRGKELARIPYAGLDVLVVESHSVSLSAHAAWTLADNGLPVILASPNGDEIAVLAPPSGNRSFVRVAQARAVDTEGVRRAAVEMLAAKVANQASLLRYLGRAPNRRQGALGASLRDAADEIRALGLSLAREGEARLASPRDKLSPVLMGYEGRAAAVYWRGLAALLPDELGFPGRRTRGAQDAVNMSLNYVYGMLYADVWRAITRAGLDPGIGILHGSERANGGLVFDLIEELRAPLADRVVLGLLGRGWSPGVLSGERAALRKSDRRVLARSYAAKRDSTLRRGRSSVRFGELPYTQALALRALVLGEAERYAAFRFRW